MSREVVLDVVEVVWGWPHVLLEWQNADARAWWVEWGFEFRVRDWEHDDDGGDDDDYFNADDNGNDSNSINNNDNSSSIGDNNKNSEDNEEDRDVNSNRD